MSVRDGGDRGRLRDKAGAAAYLSTSIDTIERLIQAGELSVVKLPVERATNGRGRVGTCRRVLIDVADLDALILRSKESSGPTPIAIPARRRAG